MPKAFAAMGPGAESPKFSIERIAGLSVKNRSQPLPALLRKRSLASGDLPIHRLSLVHEVPMHSAPYHLLPE